MLERPVISALTRERFLLGELDARERVLVEQALSEEQRSELAREDAELRERLFARLPPERLARRVTAAEQEPARPPRWAFAALGAALALIGLLVVSGEDRAVGPSFEARRGAASERAKGLAPALHVYRQRGGSAERLEAGALLRAHDLLQLGYVAAGRKYGVLVSIDGAGQAILHHPAAPELAAALDGGSGERLLPSAYEIDAAPGFERFFWVVSPEPLSVAAVLEAARALARDPGRAREAPLRVPAHAEQYTLTFRKESP